MTLPALSKRGSKPDADPIPPSDGDQSADGNRWTSRLRRMGQGLALPIAAMPAAGLLLRMGQPDMLGHAAALHRTAEVLSAAGGAMFDFLPLMFSIGVALGLNRSSDVAGRVIASVLSYLILARVVLVFAPLPADQLGTPPARWPYGALLGIVGALLAMSVWKVVSRARRQPPTFAVYGLVSVVALGVGTLLGLAYPIVDRALSTFATAIAEHSVLGGGLFGVLNRLLLGFGLHHVPSTIVWYVAGDCGGVKGDVPCYFTAHSPHAGIFMTGFFPIAMFALPAAALAMWRSAEPGAKRRRAAALLLPAAGMCAAFGITEPIEYAFLWTAPLLYGVHAILTGASLAIVNALDIHAGFLFSAGTVDYILSFPLSTRAWLLLPIGVVYGLIYYSLFRFAIRRFDLRTPGCEPDSERPTAPSLASERKSSA
ncbi:PTS transporter subunit EIIC [Streptomyces abikoensis]|uniref:PTS transporter subunit EIIC n=1 Tax=Streptomyces abikoensis TaxID=97398 RepID=UPI0034095032